MLRCLTYRNDGGVGNGRMLCTYANFERNIIGSVFDCVRNIGRLNATNDGLIVHVKNYNQIYTLVIEIHV